MSEQPARDILMHDPLSEVTRKERRMLLGISMLGVALVKTGLIPTKISALGVEFDQSNQHALLGLLALLVGYFLAAFAIYAAADYIAWRRAFYNYVASRSKKERVEILSMFHSSRLIFILAGPVSGLRAFFEFLLPIGVGAYAMNVLIRA